MSWFDEGGTGSPVDVAAIMDAEPVQQTLWRIVEAGALVSIGRTSDGGALGVTVTLDGRWRREYFRTTEDLESWLLGAAAAVEQAPPASSAPRKRRQRAG